MGTDKGGFERKAEGKKTRTTRKSQYCSLKVDLGLRTYIAGAELTFSWTYFVERLHGSITTNIKKYSEKIKHALHLDQNIYFFLDILRPHMLRAKS